MKGALAPGQGVTKGTAENHTSYSHEGGEAVKAPAAIWTAARATGYGAAASSCMR